MERKDYPPGAPSVTDNKWQEITYTTTGNVDNLGFDGVDFFNGIIWDYSAPSINVAWSLNENFGETTVVKNSLDPSGATDGTAINISESDLFTQQSNGDYLGVELWNNNTAVLGTEWVANGAGSFTLTGTSGNFNTLSNDNVGSAGNVVRTTFDVVYTSGDTGLKLKHRDTDEAVVSTTTETTVEYTVDGTAQMVFGRDLFGGTLVVTLSGITSKQFLEKA